jgi:hypothetical protein
MQSKMRTDSIECVIHLENSNTQIFCFETYCFKISRSKLDARAQVSIASMGAGHNAAAARSPVICHPSQRDSGTSKVLSFRSCQSLHHMLQASAF